MVDTIDQSAKTIIVRGFHATLGGFGGDEVTGVALNGGICFAREANGLILTGTQNLIDDFKGVVISPLRNKSIKGTGLQIGLLNICKHLKGVQIGLWNHPHHFNDSVQRCEVGSFGRNGHPDAIAHFQFLRCFKQHAGTAQVAAPTFIAFFAVSLGEGHHGVDLHADEITFFFVRAL